ncbi:hypothetical protein BC835DRAFT_551286 [Cytidiella melzeri]|nr:hypothetical protein BC835DRAFT_551286 [Cytidiella melzeri]
MVSIHCTPPNVTLHIPSRKYFIFRRRLFHDCLTVQRGKSIKGLLRLYLLTVHARELMRGECGNHGWGFGLHLCGHGMCSSPPGEGETWIFHVQFADQSGDRPCKVSVISVKHSSPLPVETDCFFPRRAEEMFAVPTKYASRGWSQACASENPQLEWRSTGASAIRILECVSTCRLPSCETVRLVQGQPVQVTSSPVYQLVRSRGGGRSSSIGIMARGSLRINELCRRGTNTPNLRGFFPFRATSRPKTP